MYDECVYSKQDVCSILDISVYTLNNWYRWEKKELKSGDVSEAFLPEPVQLENTKGRPLRWSLSMIDELRIFQKGIVRGRNGKYGKYTNCAWHA